jgi:benzil reductase ((S)-benzoin forming)
MSSPTESRLDVSASAARSRTGKESLSDPPPSLHATKPPTAFGACHVDTLLYSIQLYERSCKQRFNRHACRGGAIFRAALQPELARPPGRCDTRAISIGLGTWHAGSCQMSDSIVWISGATRGIGLALARTTPFPNARIINLSRRAHPDLESVQFDLTQPATYEAVRAHFATELAGFRGSRAIFIHSARYSAPPGFVFDVDAAEYCAAIQANAVAPLVLGRIFLSAIGPDYESGLMLISSAAANYPVAGCATYCAARAGVEMWVKAVSAELKARKPRTWALAVRPAVRDTQLVRALPAESRQSSGKNEFESESACDRAARDIWAALPARAGASVLFFDEVANAQW